MAKTETQIITEGQRRLNDSATAIYGTAEIHLAKRDVLFEMSEYMPYVTLATVLTIAGTAEIDISGTAYADLLYGNEARSFEAVEFKTDKEPRQFRNFSVLKGKLAMDIDFTPEANEKVRLYVKNAHILSDSTASGTVSTLNTRQEEIAVKWITGKVASGHAVSAINRSNIAGGKAYIDFMTWGEREVDRAMTEVKRIRKSQIAIQYPREA